MDGFKRCSEVRLIEHGDRLKMDWGKTAVSRMTLKSMAFATE